MSRSSPPSQSPASSSRRKRGLGRSSRDRTSGETRQPALAGSPSSSLRTCHICAKLVERSTAHRNRRGQYICRDCQMVAPGRTVAGTRRRLRTSSSPVRMAMDGVFIALLLIAAWAAWTFLRDTV